MRLKRYLTEWNVRFEYSGRGMIVPKRTILWTFFTSPKYVGLLWVKPDGTIMKENKKIGKMIKPDDSKATHKRLLAEIYDIIDIGKMKGMTGNLRDDVENIYEDSVRGRIIGNDIFVWHYGPARVDKKNVDRALDKIYKYIDEKLVEGRVIYETEPISD